MTTRGAEIQQAEREREHVWRKTEVLTGERFRANTDAYGTWEEI